MGVNSEFFFSDTDYPTKVKEPKSAYHLPIAGERIVWFLL